MTAASPQSLHQRIAALEQQIAALMQITGLSIDEWVSPHKAESLISLSRYQIKQLLDKAEAARVSGQRCSIKLGRHYRALPVGGFQVNWRRWQDVLAMPPEQWEGLD